ncbi:MAG: hypothetical protein FWE62_03090 [Firmicutes bacterium]|nr:hypothetical protein [Bacillota bacterium]
MKDGIIILILLGFFVLLETWAVDMIAHDANGKFYKTGYLCLLFVPLKIFFVFSKKYRPLIKNGISRLSFIVSIAHLLIIAAITLVLILNQTNDAIKRIIGYCILGYALYIVALFLVIIVQIAIYERKKKQQRN